MMGLLTTIKEKFWREQWNVGVVVMSRAELLAGTGNIANARWLFDEKQNGFYADPFVVREGGETCLFFEEYDAKTAKGRISWTRLSIKEGTVAVSKIAPALQKPFHLSYPFFVRHHGKLFMVPETAEANEIAAYECTKFPDRWTKAKTLVPNFPGIDPTIFSFGGRLWLFCTHAKKGENSHLYAFHSDNLFGFWQPHEKNPIKVDLGSARPAGPLFESTGELIRPAQNCRQTYGKEIVLGRIVKLTPSEFKEERIGELSSGDSKIYPDGIHTISFEGKFAIIDGKRFAGIKKLLWPLYSKIKKRMDKSC